MGDFDQGERKSRSRTRSNEGPVPGRQSASEAYGERPVDAVAGVPGRTSGTAHLAANDRDDGASDSNATAIGARAFTGDGEPLPFAATIQSSFGKHDISGVRAHIGGDAKDANHQLGADGFALNGRVAFSKQASLRLAAHEAAHVIQQKGGLQLSGGLDGGSSDPHERHADAVADAVVGGRSAEKLLDTFAGSSQSGTAVVQRNTGGDKSSHTPLSGPELYLSVLARDVWPAIRGHLEKVPWPNPHPHLSLQDDRAFVELVMNWLKANIDLDVPPQFDEVLAPAKPGDVIRSYTAHAPPRTWVPAVGKALGELFEDAILASLARLGPRWVSIAEHEPNLEGTQDETKPLVRYDQLIKSASGTGSR